jgi:hypothetical protein
MRAVFHEHRSHRRSGAVEQAPICTSDGSHPPPVWRGFRAKSRFPSAIGESLHPAAKRQKALSPECDSALYG